MLMNDEYEILNTIDLDMMLSDLPIDLMKENIKYQIDNPLDVGSDYSTIVLDKCRMILKSYGHIEEHKREIEQTMDDFYRFIINTLDEKFGLDVDYESMSTNQVIELGHTLYKFFILRYRKNVSRFIYKFIMKNKKMLAELYPNDDKRKDIVTVVLKKKTKNKDEIRILSNLPLVTKEVLSIDHEPESFMDLCCSSDQFEAELIKEWIENFTISGNFTDNYLSLILDRYNDVLDEIQAEVKMKLMKKIGL